MAASTHNFDHGAMVRARLSAGRRLLSMVTLSKNLPFECSCNDVSDCALQQCEVSPRIPAFGPG
jgi:hypothetical protein